MRVPQKLPHTRRLRAAFRRIHRKLRRLSWRQRTAIALVVIAVAVLAFFSSDIDIAKLHASAQRLDAPLVIALTVLLPLAAFPVFPIDVVAGMRFGAAEGMMIVASAILLQHLAAFALVNAAPRFFAARFRRLRRRLPHAAHTPVALFTAVLPGVPYFTQLYVLPIVGVPLRTYLLVSFPIHALRATVGVVFGTASEHLTPARLAGFVAYFAVVLTVSTWAYRAVRTRTNRGPKKRTQASRPRAARARSSAA